MRGGWRRLGLAGEVRPPGSTTTSATTAMSPWTITPSLRSATPSVEQSNIEFLTVQRILIDQLIFYCCQAKQAVCNVWDVVITGMAQNKQKDCEFLKAVAPHRIAFV